MQDTTYEALGTYMVQAGAALSKGRGDARHLIDRMAARLDAFGRELEAGRLTAAGVLEAIGQDVFPEHVETNYSTPQLLAQWREFIQDYGSPLGTKPPMAFALELLEKAEKEVAHG